MSYTFEDYIESIIEDFEEDCNHCGTIKELSEKQIDIIKSNFQEHRHCFDTEYENAKDDASELIVSCIYGNNVSASIECLNCNTVIVDDETLMMED